MTAVFTMVTSFLINAFPNRKLLHYGYLEQIKDITPSIIMSIIMGIPVYFMNYINMFRPLILALQVITGIILYIIISKISKNKEYNYLIKKIKSYRKDKKREEKIDSDIQIL